MTRKIPILLLFTVAFISGCIFGDDDKSTDQTDSYFPLHAGMTRTFNFSETTLSGDIISSYTSVSELSGPTAFNGKEYWGVVEDSQPNGLSLRVENDVVYTLVNNGESDTSLIEIEYLKLDVAEGAEWEALIYSQFEPQHNALVTISMKGTYLGMEPAEVPAGTFEDCMKFDVSAVGIIHIAEPVQVLHEQTEVWLAKNIGIVKIRKTLLDQGNAVGYRIQELVSYQN